MPHNVVGTWRPSGSSYEQSTACIETTMAEVVKE